MDFGYSSSVFSFWAKFTIVLLVLVAANASNENAKTVEFNVKPGGVVHSFSEKIKEYECTFTYASQGGTNEQWQMSVGLSDDDRLFSCSVWRPQGKSYLFFTQFKAEIKGATVEYASAYSQAAIGGLKDVALKGEEYIIGDSTVTHKDGKFQAELSKLTIIALSAQDKHASLYYSQRTIFRLKENKKNLPVSRSRVSGNCHISSSSSLRGEASAYRMERMSPRQSAGCEGNNK